MHISNQVGSRTCDQAFFSTKAKDMPYLAPSIEAYVLSAIHSIPHWAKLGQIRPIMGPQKRHSKNQ